MKQIYIKCDKCNKLVDEKEGYSLSIPIKDTPQGMCIRRNLDLCEDCYLKLANILGEWFSSECDI